jgi:ABC-type branched-subunit amino acid transport system ATPase component
VPWEPLIFARGLTKTFGPLRAVDAVDFSVMGGAVAGRRIRLLLLR